MCLLVYPKNEMQTAELTSLFEKMGVEFEYEQPFLSDSFKNELDKRVIEIKENTGFDLGTIKFYYSERQFSVKGKDREFKIEVDD